MRITKRMVLSAVTLLGGSFLMAGTAGRPARAETRVLVAGLPAGHAQEWHAAGLSGPVHGVPIRNFGVVCPGCLYRSAEPGNDADYDWLVAQGFKSVICLRQEHDCSATAARLKEKGVAYLHLPIGNEHAPTDEQAQEFLKFVLD